MSRLSRLILEPSRSRLDGGWSSKGTLCCQLNVGFYTNDTLREGRPLKVGENVGSRRALPWSNCWTIYFVVCLNVLGVWTNKEGDVRYVRFGGNVSGVKDDVSVSPLEFSP